jgi:peptidyl-tRNA hydrolase
MSTCYIAHMAPLRNVRHEAFARELIEAQRHGRTQAEAYQRAGYRAAYDGAEASAARLIGNVRAGITARMQELMSNGAKKAAVTVASLLAELEQARAAAQDDGQFSAAVQAIAGKARLAGLDRENGGGSGGEFSRCETVSDVLRVLLSDQSVSEVLESLATLSAQVQAYASDHAHLIASTAETARPRAPGIGAERSLALHRPKPRRR